jgi:hypothetical protein
MFLEAQRSTIVSQVVGAILVAAQVGFHPMVVIVLETSAPVVAELSLEATQDFHRAFVIETPHFLPEFGIETPLFRRVFMIVTTSVASVSLVQTPALVPGPLAALAQEESNEVLRLGVATALVAGVASGVEVELAEEEALVVEAVCAEAADMVADGTNVSASGLACTALWVK